jgi:hypothetical protein
MFEVTLGIPSKMVKSKQLHYKMGIQDLLTLSSFQLSNKQTHTHTMDEPKNDIAEWEEKLLGKVFLEDDAGLMVKNDKVRTVIV